MTWSIHLLLLCNVMGSRNNPGLPYSLTPSLWFMPVKLISRVLHWPSVAVKHCLANLPVEAVGSGGLDSLVVGATL